VMELGKQATYTPDDEDAELRKQVAELRSDVTFATGMVKDLSSRLLVSTSAVAMLAESTGAVIKDLRESIVLVAKQSGELRSDVDDAKKVIINLATHVINITDAKEALM
jgi:hypothetical protein